VFFTNFLLKTLTNICKTSYMPTLEETIALYKELF